MSKSIAYNGSGIAEGRWKLNNFVNKNNNLFLFVIVSVNSFYRDGFILRIHNL